MKSRSFRNNNPGNLEASLFTKKYGATIEILPNGNPGRFAKFPTAGKGLSVLGLLLSGPSYVNLNIKQAIERYAPSNENATNEYIKYICTHVRIVPETVISFLNAYQFLDLLRAITDFEGYKGDS